VEDEVQNNSAELENNSVTVENEVNESEQVQTPKNERPEGYDIIDPEKASPEDVQKRINYLYKQYRTSNEELRSYKEIAAEQSRLLSELQNGMGAVVDHLQSSKFVETEAQVKAQLKAAYESGDADAATDAQEKLAELKARKILAEQNKLQKPKAQPQQNQPQQPQQYDDVMYEGRDVIENWQSETDENGRLVRPWAFTKDANRPDPDYIEALAVTHKILNSPAYEHLSMEEKLRKVDERMGTKQQSQGGQNVLGSRLTTQKKTARVTLTPEMQKVAIRTKFGGSNAKTDADHIEAYRKQLEIVKSTKRS